MFTPPPSPLPGGKFQQTTQTTSTSPNGLLTPPFPSPEKLASTSQLPASPRQKKRKRYLPVLVAAVVLAVIAISARQQTMRALEGCWGLSAPKPMELPVPEVEVEAEERGSEIHAHRRQRRAHEELAHRQAGTPTGTTTHTTSTSNFLTASSAELPKYTAPPSVPSPALPVPTPFPAPFDISLSFNVTTPSCINFFNTFIQNVTFRACRPFGMLMSSSQQFQADQSNLTILTAVVGGTCATDMSPSDCGAVMDWHAEQIALGGNCGQDLNAGAALAVTALEGFRSYRMMRTAGCLQNPVTNAYCYVEAVASLLPNDLYFWVASLGIPLPNATAPTCSVCTQSLMNVYAQYAGQSGLVISQVYTQVAERAREACGAGYASAVAITSASQRGTMLSALVAAVFGALALLLQVL